MTETDGNSPVQRVRALREVLGGQKGTATSAWGRVRRHLGWVVKDEEFAGLAIGRECILGREDTGDKG